MNFRISAALGALRHDLPASLVVFLVAIPLCLGVAVASGAPAELGLVTGIVGGLVVGLLPGSSLQVSGPAAGLTVLVYEAVRAYGLATLGVIVLTAGVVQVLLGLLRVGGWFRAISSSVVLGMLAGIGVVLVIGQTYAAFDQAAPASAVAGLTGLPGLLAGAVHTPAVLVAAGLGLGTIAVITAWPHTPKRVRAVPGSLVAIAIATTVTAVLDLPVDRIQVQGILDTLHPVAVGDLAYLAQAGVLGTAVAFALIASAESLFSAAAVDQMHRGPRTRYNQELVAQGVGNTICGLLGAIPMTAVIVRSAANVRAGATTKASRTLHGLWLLLFAAFLPTVLGIIPMAALAGVLIHAGVKLLPFKRLVTLWRFDRGEVAVFVGTTTAIVATNLLEGVIAGLLMALVKSAWNMSHVEVRRQDDAGATRIAFAGNATFLRLPRLLDVLESVPHNRPVTLDLSELRHLDEACRTALLTWATHHRSGGSEVHLQDPATAMLGTSDRPNG
ncbi:SulP family inorganic anion transporter [Micromonospora sp. NPDC049523]|uniref:SulP family inorganic anion transporter n=1 Tax=Micromonospora sp. NPDC049523 TaxID=3155921 RepID=UPI00341AD98B